MVIVYEALSLPRYGLFSYMGPVTHRDVVNNAIEAFLLSHK